MKGFRINGEHWGVRMVDRSSNALIDRTGERRLATTDPHTMTVYLSSDLSGDMLARVLIHEIGHCVMWSHGLIYELHEMVKPRYWVKAEEWVCNLIADYGVEIYKAARSVIGTNAIMLIPDALDRIAA